MLEVRVNRPHLANMPPTLPIGIPAFSKAWDFVRELFTIDSLDAFAKECDLRPVRPIGIK
jgi:hypothetical protein